MSNLQDLIKLAKADGGKFFVMDEQGEAKLVIMSVEEYQRLLLGKPQEQAEDVEQINREIIQAQLQDKPVVEPPVPVNLQSVAAPRVESRQGGPVISENQHHHKFADLREEVIDPSFDFEGPKMEFEDI